MILKQLILLLLIPLLLGAAPSRTRTYTSGQVISPTDVTENEDNIFSYLQAGVDTYRNNSLNADAIQSSAISTVKIAAGAVTTTSILDGTIANVDVSSSAAIGYSKLSTMSGDATITDGGALTIAANSVALTTDTTGNYVATLADAGNTTITVANGSGEGLAATVDAVDVNCNNCIDGTDIALGADAQGDVMYYNGTDWVRLAAGTSGRFLQTSGAGANPTWAASASILGASFTTLSGTTYALMSTDNATETAVALPMPRAGTLTNLTSITITRTAAADATFMVMLNGATTILTTTHTGAQSSTPQTDTDSVTVASGDTVSIRYIRAGASDAGIKATVEFR